MIALGFVLLGVYLIPFSPDATLLIALGLIMFGTVRAYLLHGQRMADRA